MRTQIRVLTMMTVLLLLFASGCATVIHDNTHCALIPSVQNGVLHPGGGGATCDGFLSSHQQILGEDDWQALMLSWEKAGQAVECTTSGAIGDLKKEIEELCSRSPCDAVTTQKIIFAVNRVIENLEKNVRFAQARFENLLQ